MFFCFTTHTRRYIDKWELAVKNKAARPELFADIKDRISIYENKCQLYATQKTKRQGFEKDSVYLKICDINKLNDRRKSLGLAPLNIARIRQAKF